MVFEKNAKFSAENWRKLAKIGENWRKSQKIERTTSTPCSFHSSDYMLKILTGAFIIRN
jgi:ribosomal protein L32E